MEYGRGDQSPGVVGGVRNRVEAGSQVRGQGRLTDEVMTSEGASCVPVCTGDGSGKFWSSRETGVTKIT